MSLKSPGIDIPTSHIPPKQTFVNSSPPLILPLAFTPQSITKVPFSNVDAINLSLSASATILSAIFFAAIFILSLIRFSPK